MSNFSMVCDTATTHGYLSELISSVMNTYIVLPPVPPTHPRKCSVSPGKHVPFFPLFSFICHGYCKLHPPPLCCVPPPDAHTRVSHTHTHNGCLNGKLALIWAVTVLSTRTHLSDYLIDKHGNIKPYSSRLPSRRRKNNFPKLAQHGYKEGRLIS